MHTPPPPDSGQPSGTPAPFTHTPRPAWVPEGEHANQRRYGRTLDAAYDGVLDPSGQCRASVFRVAGALRAEVRVTLYSALGKAEAMLPLAAPALRELARCLIDAAHDIDGGQP